MKTILHMVRALSGLFLLFAFPMLAFPATPQQSNFTYQGQLQQNGQPANGNFDLTFALFDDATVGVQQGSTTPFTGYPVSGGLFTVSLSYPSTFTGNQLWLEVTVNGITMSPRTQVTTVPVAQYSLSGAIANGSVTTAALANGNVTRAKLAGANVTGSVGFTLGANACGGFTVGAGGAQVGDLVVLTYGAGVTPPAGIVFGPGSVTATGTVKFSACNVTGSSASVSTTITLQTFR